MDGSSATTLDQTMDGSSATALDQTMDGSSATATPSVSAGSQSKAPAVRSGSRHNVSQPSRVSDTSDDAIEKIPDRLGGYKVMRMLGRGAMGSVYQAKQLSLDRIVALKTIRRRFANNPASLARFTREAYAAAQLTHHNVVQIYDFGEEDGKHFFSMEWVRGGPLSDLIRDKGAIDPKLAAGYILQAARGLQFAHQNGMVHRDVKPANLLLSEEGVVKVADLGLVKIPGLMDPETDVGATSMSGLQSGTQVTMMGSAVGTPAYMAPEQSIDAATVDHRADVYSLGCSLFFMLAGRPPFDGTMVSEVTQQHAQQPTPDLVKLNQRIPPQLNQIVHKAMAKRPTDRYATLATMIGDLEAYLGVSKDGSFSPSSEQADQWEAIAKDYRKSTPLLRLSGPILIAFLLVCGLITLAMPLVAIRWLLLGPAMMLLGVATPITLAGNKSPVGISARKWISSLSWFDYIIGVVGMIVALLVALTTGIWLGGLVGLILGAIAGAVYHFGVFVPSQRGAAEAIQQAEHFLRDMRIDGADEDGLRTFAGRYGGKSWQPLYESLFGYESLCKIRDQFASDPSFSSGNTKKSWRDSVCNNFLAKAELNQQSRDQKHLAKIEERGLASEGMSAAEAREQAWAMAQAIVANAQSASKDSSDAAVAVQLKRERQKAMLAEARSGKFKRKRDPLAFIKFALSGQTRLLAGCLLLGIFAIWAQQSGLIQSVQADGVSLETVQGESESNLLGASTSHWSIGIAGLLLSLSAFVSGWRMTPFAVVATIVILFGPSLGIPTLGSMLQSWMIAAAIGMVIYVPGIIWGEEKTF